MVRVRCRGGGLPVLAAVAAAVLAPACLASQQDTDGESCAEDETCMQVAMLQNAAQVMPQGNATLLPMAAEGDWEDVGLNRAVSAEPPSMMALGASRLVRHAAILTAGSSTMLLILIPLAIILLCCCCGRCCRHLFHGGGFLFGFDERKGKGKGKDWEKDRYYDYDYRYDQRYDPQYVPTPGAPSQTHPQYQPQTVPPGTEPPPVVVRAEPVREGYYEKGYGKDKGKYDRDYRDNRRNW